MTKVKAQLEAAIFLDLEGPMVSHRSIINQNAPHLGELYGGRSQGWHRFVDPVALGLVARLAVDFAARIVVTSTLRRDHHVMASLYSMLYSRSRYSSQNGGLDLLHGVTEDFGGQREREVQQYITDHEVQRWVAIDDRTLQLTNFVQVDSRDGFTYANYQDCKPFLARPGEEVKPEAIFI